jgi:adenosylcobinamide kinase/adenosylcobinamide-phosphate guanylyltransferase
MGKFIFILGGVRSGKSAYVQQRAKEQADKVIYVATGQIGDSEMKKRIASHIRKRPRHWKTIEEPINLVDALKRCKGKAEIIIIDCLTLFLSNLMLRGFSAQEIFKTVRNLARCVVGLPQTVFLIANEIGLGIVPENKMAREFRDIAGAAHQIMAKNADEVVFMQAGLPMRLK